MIDRNNSKYVLCMNETASYLRIDLDELNSLKIPDYILDYGLKNDKHLYIHADCLSDISNIMKSEGKSFNPPTIVCKTLDFLNDTVKYNQPQTKLKF